MLQSDNLHLKALVRQFPQTFNMNGDNFVFRMMDANDRAAILAFARRLTEKDLLFMRRDITRSEAVDEWVRDIERDRAITVIVELNSEVVAYGTLYYNQLFWNRHLAEIRLLVSLQYRNRGIGTRLTRELMRFAKEMGLEKAIAYTPADDRLAQHMLAHLGFCPEALLSDWVITRDDRTHDLLIMSTTIQDIQG